MFPFIITNGRLAFVDAGDYAKGFEWFLKVQKLCLEESRSLPANLDSCLTACREQLGLKNTFIPPHLFLSINLYMY